MQAVARQLATNYYQLINAYVDIRQQVLSGNGAAAGRSAANALILLDLSAAFDTVDHSILLQRLQTTFGIHDAAHRWFHSYLPGRYQYVRRGSVRSSVIELICGVPQGSVLGPIILFVLYTADLVQLIETFGLSPHLYADDTQVYGSCPVHQQLWRYLRHRSLSAWMLLRRG